MNKPESPETQSDYIRNRAGLMAWSMHVTTDVLSVVRINQMIDQNTSIIIIFIVISLNTPGLAMSSGGHGHCLTLSLS